MDSIGLVLLGAAVAAALGWLGFGSRRGKKSTEAPPEAAQVDDLEEQLHDEVDRRHDALARMSRADRYRAAVARLMVLKRRLGDRSGGE